MLLTLTVSPEALEDVGCLHALGPRGLTACHRIVARRSMGLNAQPPTIHSWAHLFMQHLDPAGAPQEGPDEPPCRKPVQSPLTPHSTNA